LREQADHSSPDVPLASVMRDAGSNSAVASMSGVHVFTPAVGSPC
jgi:hypothetical protein